MLAEESSMSIARLEFVIRLLGGILAGALAWETGRNQLVPSIPILSSSLYLPGIVLYLLVVACIIAAFALTPYITTRPFFWSLQKVIHTPMEDILAAAGGLIVGLLIAVLLYWPLSALPF